RLRLQSVPQLAVFACLPEAPMDSAGGTKAKMGVIGVGLMGRPMALNLVKAGHSVTVWDRTASRAGELGGAGATAAEAPRDVAAASDVLITMVSDPAALEEVLWGADGNKVGAAFPALKP